MRYSSTEEAPWKDLEQPLWKHLFSHFNSRTILLDFGAGLGKVTTEALRHFRENFHGINPKNILGFEPNPILASEYKKHNQGVRCVRRLAPALHQTPWSENFTLVAANMVHNHMTTKDFSRAIKFTSQILRPQGTLAFVIPHPEDKAAKHNFHKNIQEFTIEEPAPWGGLTEYHHRSLDLIASILTDNNFLVQYAEYGLNNPTNSTTQEFQMALRGDKPSEPKRLMVIGRKDISVPFHWIKPRSHRSNASPVISREYYPGYSEIYKQEPH